MVNWRTLVGLVVIAAIGTAVWNIWGGNFNRLLGGNTQLQQATRSLADQTGIGDITRSISAPDPLLGPKSETQGALTTDGVFVLTNQQRLGNGRKVLQHNSKLDAAAKAKLDDLFAQQYFEHVSPDGRGPAEVVIAAGYAYVRVGENLALGNFANDTELVQAWMNSPGHRANILSSGYQELGIAVGQGQYEGRQVWIGVQEFGMPESACPVPDATTKQTIGRNQKIIGSTQYDLAAQKQTIEDAIAAANKKITDGNAQIQQGNETYKQTGDKQQAQTYWDKGAQLQQEGQAQLAAAQNLQDTYNEQATTLNNLIEQTKALSKQYNNQVNTFNNCVQKFDT